MSGSTQHRDNLSEFEAALASLTPVVPRLDRDELMFQAGRASVSGRSTTFARVAWPATAACLACFVLVLGISLAQERAVRMDRLAPQVESFSVAADDVGHTDDVPETPTVTSGPERDQTTTAYIVRESLPTNSGLGPPESNLELRDWLLVAGVSAWNETRADAMYRNPRHSSATPNRGTSGSQWKTLDELYRETMALSTGADL